MKYSNILKISDFLNKEIVLEVSTSSDTKNIAKQISQIIKRGDNIFLSGNLGVGKTFFTNELLKNLKVRDFVNSPSFKLVNEYNCSDFKVFHFDLYRLDDISEILYLGWDEYLNSNNICIVEWAEKAKLIWPKNYFEIIIEHLFEEADSKKLIDFSKGQNRIIKIKKVE